MISVSASGQAGDGDSFAPAMSADGSTVAFESYATNLVDGDTNGVRDVFVWSASTRPAPTLRRVSVGPADVQADGESFAPTVSGDGRVVAFATTAANLTGGVVGNTTVNVVRRDLVSGRQHPGQRRRRRQGRRRRSPRAVARTPIGWRSGRSRRPSPPGTATALWDIFVYQHDSGTRRRISLTAAGGERSQGVDSTSRVVSPAISGDGRFVAYATTAGDVVSGDTNGAQDVFVVDLDGALGVRRVSVGGAGQQGDGDSPVGQGERVALSYDGTWMAFRSQASNLGARGGQHVPAQSRHRRDPRRHDLHLRRGHPRAVARRGLPGLRLRRAPGRPLREQRRLRALHRRRPRLVVGGLNRRRTTATTRGSDSGTGLRGLRLRDARSSGWSPGCMMSILMTPPQARNPLHGITLETIINELVAHFGWGGLADQVRINCFSSNPSVKRA